MIFSHFMKKQQQNKQTQSSAIIVFSEGTDCLKLHLALKATNCSEIRTRQTGPATNIVQIFLKGLFTICSGCSIVKLQVLRDIFESSSRSVSSKYQSVAIRSQKSEQNLYSAKNISTQLSVSLSFPFPSFPFLSTPMEQFLLIAMKSC